ncbi:hypothetical protein ACHAW6_014610 [Cyclotella cf. meneghiniana]
MLLAAIGLRAKEVLHIVLSHVEWFIPIADTPSVLAFPIRIPQRTGTSVVKLTHATIIVPGKMSGAALIESGMHVDTGIRCHVGGLVSVVQTSLVETFTRPVGIEKVDRRSGSRGLRRLRVQLGMLEGSDEGCELGDSDGCEDGCWLGSDEGSRDGFSLG